MSETAMNEPGVPASHSEPEAEISKPAPALGAQLAAEREARGWSIEQVATQLNLAPRQIQALELDNYPALPGMASVRGFIRAYAKLLKIDATPLIAMISPGAIAPTEPVALRRALSSAPFSDNRSLSSRRHGLRSKLVIAALSLLAVLALVFVGEQMGWVPGTRQPLTAVLKELGAPSAAEPEMSPNAGAAQSNDAGTTAKATIATTPTSIAATPTPVEPAAAAVVPEAAPVATATAKPNPTSDELVLKLHEDSWVEIRRANNSALIARLVKAGSTETFQITEPVSLTLGNAAGVDASLRGAPVDLKSTAKNNVARVNLK